MSKSDLQVFKLKMYRYNTNSTVKRTYKKPNQQNCKVGVACKPKAVFADLVECTECKKMI